MADRRTKASIAGNPSIGLQFRPRQSVARRIRLRSSLQQYNPEIEAAQVRGLQHKKIRLYVLFRYASWLDICLIVIGVLSSIACAVCLPFLIYRQGKIIHYGIENDRCKNINNNSNDSFIIPIELIEPLFVDTMWIALASCISCFIFVVCFAISAENQIAVLRAVYFESLIRKDMSWLDNYVEREFGRHMTHDITQIRTGIGEKLCYVLYVVVVIANLIGTAFYREWKIALIMTVLGPVATCIGYLNSYAENQEAVYVETVNTNSGVIAEETLANIKTVKVYEGEAKEIHKYDSSLRLAFGWKWILLGGTAGAASLLMLLSYAITLYFGSSIVWDHLQNKKEISTCTPHEEDKWEGPEDLFIVFFCLLFASLHILELPTLLSQINGAVEVATEVFFMIDWKPRIDNMSEAGDLPDSAAIGKIEFEDVSFRYPRKPNYSALHNIQMIIYPGQVIGLVGSLGCGKSTVLRLIQRLYDPTGGNIYLDGHNVENLNVRWLRSNIAMVSQEPVLFNKSVEENVRFARWSATSIEVQQACKLAGIHDDILQLKQGYKTIVGYHGNLLTTSQKRQLSFARAYLHKPKILLMDDPVAGCVAEFEELVLRVITELRDRTTIVLASTVINSLVQTCDRIYFIDKGSILERGNHDHLMALGGAYAALKNQAGTETNSRFISQLTSYRFAQSLRRMHLRKSRALQADQRKVMTPNTTTPHGDPNSATYLESQIHALHHNSRVRTNQAVVLRVAGGLQRFNYTRTQGAYGGHIRRNLDKGIRKVQHERGLQKMEVVESKQDNSVVVLLANEMQRQRASFSYQFDVPRPKGIMRGRSDSIGSNTSSTQYSDKSDGLSIASEDSIMFWADYEEMLDELEEDHSLTSWKDLVKLGLIEWKFVLGSIVSSFFLGCCPALFAVILAEIFGTFTKAERIKAEEEITKYCILLVILAFTTGTFAFIQELMLSLGGYKMMAHLRGIVFAGILDQDQDWFDKPQNDISFLCARLSADTTLVQNALVVSVCLVVQNLTTMVVAIYFAFETEGTHLLASYAIGLGFLVLIVACSDSLFQKEWEWITDVKALDEATEIEIDVITNIRTVITLGLENHFLTDFKNILRKSRMKLFALNIARSLLFALAYALPFACFSILLYLFLTQDHGEAELKEVLKLNELLIFGFLAVGTAFAILPNTSLSLGAAYRINRILTHKSRSKLKADASPPSKKDFQTPPKIELKNVEFNFNLNLEYSVLRGISFVAEKQQKIAVVGPAGCGKSSVIQLLLRLYEPSNGSICIDDDDFVNVDVKSTRKITSFVEQNPAIFDCSIKENIAYGDNSREVPMNEIIEAAKLANAHSEIIRLPQSYDTQVSSLDSHQESSFGLRQRIVFARAMIRNPKLLLIDEATASLDSVSDFVLLKALDCCCTGRTSIIASQRIEPIRNADFIIVLNNGYIIESGLDRELIEAQGHYFNMYMSQREAEGLSTNVDDLEYKQETMNEDNEETGSRDSRGRRRSSVQYINYLKKRLNYVPQVRERTSLHSVDSDYWVGYNKNLDGNTMNEYADFITSVDLVNEDATQGQQFLRKLRPSTAKTTTDPNKQSQPSPDKPIEPPKPDKSSP